MRTALKVLLTAAALATSWGASAQSVTFLFNDNTSRKFSTDRVNSIAVVTSAEASAAEVNNLSIEAYGRNAVLKFSNDDKSLQLSLDLYGPQDALFLHTGNYTVKDGGEAFSISTDAQYTNVVKAGETFEVQGGNVAVSADGRVYTIAGTLTLSDGSEQAFQFVGPLPSYSPYREFVISKASYNENPQQPGVFYVKMNDAAYNLEMALVLVAESSNTVLPAGEYVRATDAAVLQPGTFTTGSYIDLFNPQYSDREFTGTLTVDCVGNVYTLVFDASLSNGQKVAATYEGEISGTPTFTDPAKEAGLKKGPSFNPTR